MATKTKTHYTVLGVPSSATAQEVKAAYRKLARTTHPDMPGGSGERFAAVAEAFEVLSDPGRRAVYDADLRQAAHRAQTPPRPARPAPAASASHVPFSRPTQAAGRPTAAPYTPPWFAPRTFVPPRPAPVPAPKVLRWWTFPLVCVVLAAAAAVRLTGATAAVFGAQPGMRIFGGTWYTAPTVADVELLPAALMLGLLAASLTLGYQWRASLAPLPRTEVAAVAVGVVALVGAGEFLLVSGTARLSALALAAAYGVWLWVLHRAPRPVTQDQWASMRTWVAAVFAARRAQRRAQRQLRRERRLFTW